jgi:hypothetical protein
VAVGARADEREEGGPALEAPRVDRVGRDHRGGVADDQLAAGGLEEIAPR